MASRRAIRAGFFLNHFYYIDGRKLMTQVVFDTQRVFWGSREGNGNYLNRITALRLR
jgi:hypothetical protein